MRSIPVLSTNGEIPFTRSGIVSPFVSYLDRIGVPTTRYLEKSGIPPVLLEDTDALIPLTLAFGFLQRACMDEGIDSIGLRVARETSLNHLGPFGHYLLGSRNVLQYLTRGARLIRQIQSATSYHLTGAGHWVQFRHRQVGPYIKSFDAEQSHLFALLITIDTIRRAAGGRWSPPELRMPSLTPDALRALSELMPDTRIILGDPDASFMMPRSFLALPVGGFGAEEEVQAGDYLPDPHLPGDCLSSVKLFIESLITGGYPGIAVAAEAAGTSVRSFKRRLADCGTNYSDLVAETRMTMAERWLREGTRSVSEIASALGYKDRSNFSRAFSRLNGISPMTYRDTVIRNNLR
jgi:AraC-like DNA-binding protein